MLPKKTLPQESGPVNDLPSEKYQKSRLNPWSFIYITKDKMQERQFSTIRDTRHLLVHLGFISQCVDFVFVLLWDHIPGRGGWMEWQLLLTPHRPVLGYIGHFVATCVVWSKRSVGAYCLSRWSWDLAVGNKGRVCIVQQLTLSSSVVWLLKEMRMSWWPSCRTEVC